jgi:putative ABC transport system permease protein
VTGGWRIAVRNLGRNRRRNAATALAIALGYAALILLGGYQHYGHEGLGVITVYLQHLGHLSIYRPGGLERAVAKPVDYAFSPDEQRQVAALLAADPRVEFTGRMLRAGGLAGSGCESIPFVATGVEPEVERRILDHPATRRWAAERARPVEGVALPEAPREEAPVALALGLARKLHKRPSAAARPPEPGPIDCGSGRAREGDPYVQLAAIDFEGSFNALDARVTSIYRAVLYDEDKQALTLELEGLQRLLATDRVTSFSVYLRDPEETRAVEGDLSARLAAAGIQAELHRYDEPDANPYYAGLMETMGAFVGFFGLLFVAVAALTLLNAMTLTVMERTRELATFRSLGFTRGQVTGLFLREATALTAVGIAAGLVLGLAAAFAVRGANIQVEPSGMAGTFQLLMTPSPSVCAAAAAAYFPFSLVATWVAVRRSVAQPVAKLLTAVTA